MKFTRTFTSELANAAMKILSATRCAFQVVPIKNDGVMIAVFSKDDAKTLHSVSYPDGWGEIDKNMFEALGMILRTIPLAHSDESPPYKADLNEASKIRFKNSEVFVLVKTGAEIKKATVETLVKNGLINVYDDEWAESIGWIETVNGRWDYEITARGVAYYANHTNWLADDAWGKDYFNNQAICTPPVIGSWTPYSNHTYEPLLVMKEIQSLSDYEYWLTCVTTNYEQATKDLALVEQVTKDLAIVE